MEKKLFCSNLNSDRISELPEPIRKRILSFLPTKSAVRASILSSSWRALWTDLPNLNLGVNQLSKFLTNERFSYFIKNDDDKVNKESIDKKREEFYRFLDRALESNLELKKLDLYVPGYGIDLKSRVDRWLECGVKRGVKELRLEIGLWTIPRYSLPESVLGASLITKLSLERCEINSSSLVDKVLPSLQAMRLERVDLDDGVIECLPSLCPNVEVLVFKCCSGLTSFVVSGLIKLKTLDFETSTEGEIDTMEVVAPNRSVEVHLHK